MTGSAPAVDVAFRWILFLSKKREGVWGREGSPSPSARGWRIFFEAFFASFSHPNFDHFFLSFLIALGHRFGAILAPFLAPKSTQDRSKTRLETTFFNYTLALRP